MRSDSLQGQTQAVEADNHSRPCHVRALGRVLEQNRIRVVDVGIDAVLARQRGSPPGSRRGRQSAGDPFRAPFARRHRARSFPRRPRTCRRTARVGVRQSARAARSSRPPHPGTNAHTVPFTPSRSMSPPCALLHRAKQNGEDRRAPRTPRPTSHSTIRPGRRAERGRSTKARSAEHR